MIRHLFFESRRKTVRQESAVTVEQLISEEDLENAIQRVAKTQDWFLNPVDGVIRGSLREWLTEHLIRKGASKEEAERATERMLPSLAARASDYFKAYLESPGLEKKLANLTTTYYLRFLHDTRWVRVAILPKN